MGERGADRGERVDGGDGQLDVELGRARAGEDREARGAVRRSGRGEAGKNAYWEGRADFCKEIRGRFFQGGAGRSLIPRAASPAGRPSERNRTGVGAG
jgi:hypothetical protein